MILAGMFIFLVILSHGQMTTANELKKLNERMGPAPHPPLPTAAAQPKYEYLVERFYQIGAAEYADFLNNKSAEGWELFQDTTLSNDINYGNCIFRRRMS